MKHKLSAILMAFMLTTPAAFAAPEATNGTEATTGTTGTTTTTTGATTTATTTGGVAAGAVGTATVVGVATAVGVNSWLVQRLVNQSNFNNNVLKQKIFLPLVGATVFVKIALATLSTQHFHSRWAARKISICSSWG